jgi:translation initiation factor 1
MSAVQYRPAPGVSTREARVGRGDSRLVYSSGSGRICPRCGRPVARCACTERPRAARGDGVVRVRREVQGRRGKTVTTVSGVPLASDALSELAAELKRRCGSGGSAKDGVIEIQGDHREALVAELERRGYTVKLAGG